MVCYHVLNDIMMLYLTTQVYYLRVTKLHSWFISGTGKYFITRPWNINSVSAVSILPLIHATTLFQEPVVSWRAAMKSRGRFCTSTTEIWPRPKIVWPDVGPCWVRETSVLSLTPVKFTESMKPCDIKGVTLKNDMCILTWYIGILFIAIIRGTYLLFFLTYSNVLNMLNLSKGNHKIPQTLYIYYLYFNSHITQSDVRYEFNDFAHLFNTFYVNASYNFEWLVVSCRLGPVFSHHNKLVNHAGLFEILFFSACMRTPLSLQYCCQIMNFIL